MTTQTGAPARPAAVAGTFYPDRADRLARLVDRSIDVAATIAPPRVMTRVAGILVPHAGLEYSGVVAAAGWRTLLAGPADVGSPARAAEPASTPGSLATGGAANDPDRDRRRTVVILGTNHRAGWLEGLGVWPAGAWTTPLGSIEIDEELAEAIAAAGDGFVVDRAAHLGEHSIEVQLPFVRVLDPTARIVPIAVAAGRGNSAALAGHALGAVIGRARSSGQDVALAISTDMAHYPPAGLCGQITETLLPALLGLDVDRLDGLEREVTLRGGRGTVCGMCGIEPALVGLAALRALGARAGVRLASATSADAGGPSDRTVGYLSVAFPG